MSNELTPRDERVIATIQQVRAEFHACTAAEVAARLKFSKAYIHEVVWSMIDRGLVAFSPTMPGSLRVVADATTTVAGEGGGYEATTVEADDHRCDECDWPTKQALVMHKRKKH